MLAPGFVRKIDVTTVRLDAFGQQVENRRLRYLPRPP